MDTAVHDEITRLCAEGDALAEADRFNEAIHAYAAAFRLVPEPFENWPAATWILAAIGDAYFLTGAMEQACDALTDAMRCPGAIGNPFLHLRLGQVQYELGDLDRSADELIRAYALEGPEMFDGEDPKYLTFLGTRAIIPGGSFRG